jgi:hypothetical protein
MTGDTVAYNLCERDRMALILEPLPQLYFAAGVRNVSDKQSQHRDISPLLTHFSDAWFGSASARR